MQYCGKHVVVFKFLSMGRDDGGHYDGWFKLVFFRDSRELLSAKAYSPGNHPGKVVLRSTSCGL